MPNEPINPQEHCRRFIERVLEGGQVWGLRSGDDWACCASNEFEDTDVVVFWSDRAGAERNAMGEWGAHKPTAITVDEFIDNWLAGLDQEGALVGPDWNTDLDGPELEPHEVAEQLSGDGAA